MGADATPESTSTRQIDSEIPGKGTATVGASCDKEIPERDRGWVGERRKEIFLEIETAIGEENVQVKCYGLVSTMVMCTVDI